MAFDDFHYPPKPHAGCKTTVGSCHKCRAYAIAEAVSRGERVTDADREEARAACMNCRGGADISEKGESILRLGAFAAPDEFIESELDEISLLAAKAPRTEQATPLPPNVESIALELVRTFAALPFPAVVYLYGVLNGLNLEQAGRLAGMTKQNISSRFKEAQRHFPFLAKIAPMVIRASRAKSTKGGWRGRGSKVVLQRRLEGLLNETRQASGEAV